MIYPFITLNTILRETIEDYALDTQQVPELLIKRWAMDGLQMVPTTEELRPKVAYLVVTDGRTELPQDYKHLHTIVGRAKAPCSRTKRVETLVQWSQTTPDPDVTLEIRAKCTRCHEDKCTCGAPMFEVDVDRAWAMANPQAYFKGYNSYGTWGNGGGKPDPLEAWTLLRPSTGAFSMSAHFVSDCPNLQAPREAPSFNIDLPMLNTSFMTGEIMISYLAKQTDEDGDLMVPEQVDLIQGIKDHVMHKWFMRLYTRSIGAKTESSQAYLQAANLHAQSRERSMSIYRAAALQPDPISFQDFMRNVWLQRIPDPNYDHAMGTPQRGMNARYSHLLRQ